MKWFLKALRHYADFSGRARRKEYWMFVLFNIIFSFAWSLFMMLLMFVFWLVSRERFDPAHLALAGLVANASYSLALMLPTIALTVRRLHDTGKSGWRLLIGLIPLVGAICLFVWMLLEGAPQENKYGPNPKNTLETFSESAKLKSAGLTLLLASAVLVLGELLLWMVMRYLSYLPGISSYSMVPCLCCMLLLTAGIFLMAQKQKVAMPLLLAVGSILFLLFAAWTLIRFGFGERSIPLSGYLKQITPALSSLAVAFLAASVLFLAENKNLLRMAALFVIAFAVLDLLSIVCFTMIDMSIINTRFGMAEFVALQQFKKLLSILMPIAYILLASTFYPPKGLKEDAGPDAK